MLHDEHDEWQAGRDEHQKETEARRVKKMAERDAAAAARPQPPKSEEEKRKETEDDGSERIWRGIY